MRTEKRIYRDFHEWSRRVKELGFTHDGQFGRFGNHRAYDTDDHIVGFWNANVTMESGWIEEPSP